MREKLIEELKSGQKQVAALLESVADNQDWQSAPKEWSFRYVAAHLATVDKECFLNRVRRIASGERPHFDYYLNTGWDFSQLDLQDSLQQWAITRQAIIDFVEALPEEKLRLTGTHVSFGEITILDTLQIIVDHDQEHLQELRPAVAACIGKVVEERCKTEVVELHQFFQDWLNGNLEPTGENFARLTNVMEKSFVIISPSGVLTERDPLLNSLRRAHNSRNNCKIWIENFQLHLHQDDIAITTYEEWQKSADGATNVRLSTAVFQEKPVTANGVAWLHVHETWLAKQ